MEKNQAKTPNEFVEFLKKEGVYRQFKENRNAQFASIGSNMDEYVKNLYRTTIQNAVIEAFRWAETDEQDQGFQFWSSIDQKWKRECRNGKR